MKIGLIGKNLTHSYSKIIHQLLGCESYEIYDLPTIESLEPLNLDAFNVTHPYKNDVLKYLKDTDDIVKATQSVNTVIKKNNDYFGFNTDYFGFKSMMEHYQIDFNQKNVAIVGHGATARTIVYYLNQQNIKSYIHLVRTKKSEKDILLENQSSLSNIDIIINTTPVGMYPQINQPSLIDFSLFPNCKYAIDVIYNPFRSSFLVNAEEHHIKTINGLYMLYMQAVKTEELIYNKSFKTTFIEDKFNEFIFNKLNIIFIGMPMSGKSYIGNELSKTNQFNLIDTDSTIENDSQLEIKDIFSNYGESYFRELELKLITQIYDITHTVISTGGGVVLNQKIMDHLRKLGLIVFIDKDIELTSHQKEEYNSRPLLNQKNDLIDLYHQRISLYKKYADVHYIIDQEHPHSIERLRKNIYEYFNH